MVLALLTVPPVTARLLTHRMKPLLLLSVLIACLASTLGGRPVAPPPHRPRDRPLNRRFDRLPPRSIFVVASLWNKKALACLLLFPLPLFGCHLEPADPSLIEPRIVQFYASELIQSGLFPNEEAAFKGIKLEKAQEDPAKQFFYFHILSPSSRAATSATLFSIKKPSSKPFSSKRNSARKALPKRYFSS